MAMRVWLMLGVVVGLTTATGCGGPAAVDRAAVPSPCDSAVAAQNPADTVTVVLFDKVDLAHAPWPQNREERFVFSHLYETLVTIDCRGEIRPGLASSWKKTSDGWMFELRKDATFWDSAPVTAHDVAASFLPAIRAGIAIHSVDAIDEHRLLVSRRNRDAPDPMRLLALHMLAVSKKTGPSEFPVGTGPWCVDTDPDGDTIMLSPAFETRGPVVRFVAGTGDARDVIDNRADAMITDDPTAIEYARSRPNSFLLPLAWDRAYVLLSRERALRIAAGATVASLPASLRDALARDAVRTDARGESTIVANLEGAYEVARPGHREVPEEHRFPATPRVVYPANDATARGLAERIVALAAMDPLEVPDAGAILRAIPGAIANARAAGVESEQFTKLLMGGQDLAYVLPLSWCLDTPLLTTQLVERAWWLLDPDHPVDLSRAIIPLVETRAHLVVLSDRVSLVHDGAGNVRVMTSIAGRSQ
jgi:hypothetical protein